jgi:hypothetical protein
MTDTETSQTASAAFEALCDGLEEYEPLPTRLAGHELGGAADVTASTGAAGPEDAGSGEDAGDGDVKTHLDAEILAGLVSP